MKKKFFVIILASLLLLCGCGKEEDPDAIDFSTAPTIPVVEVEEFPLLDLEGSGSSTATLGESIDAENGVFHLRNVGLEGFGRIIYFTDYETGETYPTCVRTNCTHDSEDCGAYVYGYRLVHYDGTWLYYCSSEKGSDILVKQKPDGSDRQTVFTSESETGNATMGTLEDFVVSGDDLYFTVNGALFDPETGEFTTGEKVCRANLKTGKITSYPILDDDSEDGDISSGASAETIC